MKIQNLHDLLVYELRDLYSAETQIEMALPVMAKQAHHPDLRMAFESHLRETQGHIERLRQVAAILEFNPEGHTCLAMKGIIAETNAWIAENAPHDVKDAGLIAQAQRVEHYEIAGYGTVRALAERFGHADVVVHLEETLREEKTADQRLTRLAVSGINSDAAAANASTL